jgi:hypothetical protein
MTTGNPSKVDGGFVNDFRTHVREALNRADGVPVAHIRVAKGPPPPPQQGGGKNGGGFPGQQPGMEGGPGGMTPPGTQPSNRQIPSNHKFDTAALKPLAKMLWAMSVSLGHALQAYRIFNRVKSSTVSPDGMVGGRGYIMKVTELRQQLYDACEALSAVSDTIHDEINAPHWKPKIGELSSEDFEAIERLIGESEHLLDNPEEEIEDEESEVEKKGKPSSSWVKKMKQKSKDDAKPGSDLPDGGDQETAPSPKRPMKMKEASSSSYDRRGVIEASWRDALSHGGWAIDENAARIARILSKVGDSSVNPDSLGGPRVKHLDRGDSDQDGPMGTVNPDEPVEPKDPWGRDEGVSGEPMSQDYGNQPSYQWDGGRNAMPQQPVAVSSFPDSNLDTTPTEAFDFGIGRGEGNDAHGQGAKGQSQTYSPSMGDKGVYGPAAELPDDPGGKTHDRENSDPGSSAIDEALNNSHKSARERLRQLKALFVGPDGPRIDSKLPGDDDKDVARSDYYTGPKDNDIDTIKGPTENPVLSESELPNSSPHSKPAPLIPRPFSWGSQEFATSQVPGDGAGKARLDSDMGLMDTSYHYEQQDEPYVKWDDSTHNQRVDDNTMRDPIQGPYVRN